MKSFQFHHLFFNFTTPSDNQQQSQCHRMHGKSIQKVKQTFNLAKLPTKYQNRSRRLRNVSQRFHNFRRPQTVQKGLQEVLNSAQTCTNISGWGKPGG
jgi:hypothetical protein